MIFFSNNKMPTILIIHQMFVTLFIMFIQIQAEIQYTKMGMLQTWLKVITFRIFRLYMLYNTQINQPCA